MLEQLGFSIVACALLVPGFKVVTSRNLVHTVLWLAVMLAATAVLFVMLQAPFIAAIQIILYTGGLLTLMLFGVMLTQRDEGFLVIPNVSHRVAIATLISGGGFALFALSVLRTDQLPDQRGPTISARELGGLVFTQHALAFEVLAVLLLAATLGAIVVARKADAGSPADAESPMVPARRALPHPGPLPLPTTEPVAAQAEQPAAARLPAAEPAAAQPAADQPAVMQSSVTPPEPEKGVHP